jgi:post-segregation antitoxin (ccd killing protein)
MAETKHTPTPWITTKGNGGYLTVIRPSAPQKHDDAVAFTVIRAQHPTTTQAEENAAFIVRACNSHDALVEALKNALKAGDELAERLRRVDLDLLHQMGISKENEVGEIVRWKQQEVNARAALQAAEIE